MFTLSCFRRAPTHWEKAADAILEGKLQKSFDIPHFAVSDLHNNDDDDDKNKEEIPLIDHNLIEQTVNDDDEDDNHSDIENIIENRMDVPKINIETSSLTSYKSDT